MHSEYAHQQRPVSATLFRFHIECCMYTGYIKLFVVLVNLTDLRLTWTWLYTKKLSGKQRVWIQIKPTIETSRHRDKRDVFSEWGMLPRLPNFSCADLEFFCQLGGRGCPSPTDTKKLFYIIIYTSADLRKMVLKAFQQLFHSRHLKNA